MKSLKKFFEAYKDELPFGYGTFHTKYLNEDLLQKMVDKHLVFTSGGGQRIRYKIIDDEKFKEFLFSLGMGGIK
jgi:hypothetical protein